MKYAEIKIKVFVDEEKLTSGQQIQAAKADVDIRQDHPLGAGVDDLRDTIEKTCNCKLSHFEYLNEGINAVKITVD